MSYAHQQRDPREPGRDHAVRAMVSADQSRHRPLFDCGEGCLDWMSRFDIRMVDVEFSSHFYIEIRACFDRVEFALHGG